MARSTGTYFSGSLPGVGSGQRDLFYDEFKSYMDGVNGFQSSGVDAWESYDVIDGAPAPRDEVWRSKGDRTLVGGAGDAHLPIQVKLTAGGAMQFIAYQDWSTSSSTGTRPATADSTVSFTLTDTDQIDFFGVHNEYEHVWSLVQAGTRRVFGFGSPVRSHITSAVAGIGFSTGAVGSGSNVTIPIDRDLTSSIRVGQRVWVYSVTAPAAALEAEVAETAIVNSVTTGPNEIEVDSLSNAHPSGSIVGLDPSPMYAFHSVSSSDPSVFFTNELDTQYTITSNTALFDPQAIGIEEATNDPAVTDLFVGMRASITMTTSPVGGFRGHPEHMFWWPIGTQSDEDRMLPNFDSALAQKVFPSLGNVPPTGSTYALAIGPGAT